jgi:hypothetical protein
LLVAGLLATGLLVAAPLACCLFPDAATRHQCITDNNADADRASVRSVQRSSTQVMRGNLRAAFLLLLCSGKEVGPHGSGREKAAS